MSQPNRTALLTKAHRVLKQHYKPVIPPDDRPLLEHLLFACCLENAGYEAAEKVYTYLSKHFFDWNEVRVSTVTELAEVMKSLPDPASAASNLKRILQGVFEATYSFDLESLKKQNIGQGIKWLEKLAGTTPFSVAYITHVALGGHAIPLDRGAWEVMTILGVPTDGEIASGKLAGVERAIPKNKGAEFGSLLHQLAADVISNPMSPTVRKILLDINKDAKDRLPKRGGKKEVAPAPAPQPVHRGKEDAPAKKAVAEKAPAGKAGAEKAVAEAPKPDKSKKLEHAAPADKHAKETAAKESSAKEKAEKEKLDKARLAKEKLEKEKAQHAAKHHKPEKVEHKKPAAAGHKSHAAARPAAVARKSPNKQLAKRKPR